MCNPDNRKRFPRTRCRRVLLAQVLAKRLLSPESPPALIVLVGARLFVAVLVLVLIVAVWLVVVIVLLVLLLLLGVAWLVLVAAGARFPGLPAFDSA